MPTGDALADTGATVGILVGIGSLLVMLWVWIGRPVRREWKLNREFQRQFRTDWMGVPDRDGVPGHPGVMSSLADLRTDGFRLTERVRKMERDVLRLRSEVTWLLTHRCEGQKDAPPVIEFEEG
jgi:hypothetical protein